MRDNTSTPNTAILRSLGGKWDNFFALRIYTTLHIPATNQNILPIILVPTISGSKRKYSHDIHSNIAIYVVVFIFNLANKAHAIGNNAAGIKNRNEELITVVRFTDKVKAIAIHIIHIIEAIEIFFQSCLDIEEICEKYL